MKYALLLSFFLFGCSHFRGNGNVSKVSILQGITTQKEVEFNIMCERNENLRFELRNEDDEIHSPNNIKIYEKDLSPYALYKVAFPKETGKEYNLVVYLGNKIIDQRLVGKGQVESNKLRLIVASGINGIDKDQTIWKKITNENPEYLLLVGVTPPLENNSIERPTFWKRNVELREKLPLFFQKKLIPTHVVWNDSLQEEDLEVFKAFWGQELNEEGWSAGPGLSGVLNQGDFNLYFLDGKMGLEEQENWLYSKLKEEETPSFIIKGNPFFGRDQTLESGSFINELKKMPTPFIFISGDRKLSEVMQFPRSLFGKPSFEFTAGPLNEELSGEEFENPWRVVQNNLHGSFTLIENSSEDNHWFIDVKNIGKDGEVYYKRDLAVFIKDLQNNLNQIRKRRSIKRRSYKFKRTNR